MARWLFRLARLSIRRRRLVVATWLAVVVVSVGAAAMWSGSTTNSLRIPGADSQRANDLLQERFAEFGGSSAQIVVRAPEGTSLAEPAIDAQIDEVLDLARAVPGVIDVLAPDAVGAISEDGTVGIAQVSFAATASEVPIDSVDELLSLARDPSPERISVAVGGEVPAQASPEVGLTSELIGLAVALVVLLVTFGSLAAAGMPLVAGILGVVITYASIYLVANLIDLPSTTSTLAVMIGLAVGIDYALFIVSRHREELARGASVEEAAAISTATAGGAVVFAGSSVVVAISGLAVVGIPFLATMGFAAAGATVIAVVMAVTLTPAVLAIAGTRVLPRRDRRAATSSADEAAPAGRTISERWATAVLRRPGLAIAGSIVVLGVLAAPVLDLRLAFPDDTSLPADNTRRVAYEAIDEAFGPGVNAPLTVAIDLEGAADRATAVVAVEERLAAQPGGAVVLPAVVNTAGDTAIVTVVPVEGPATPATEGTLAAIRDQADGLRSETGAEIHVTGLTATNIDVSDALSDALVPFLLLVLGLMMVILVLAFRSVVIAIKAVVAILLSVAASFGVLVAVFQWGWLAGLIGVEETLPIIPFLPIIMFAILFGLSMDYEVFILSRVRERITAGDGAAVATLHGLGVSAKVITAAALIMIAVFGSFIAQVDPTIKMFGLGLAVAVLLDATIVRMVFVPAALALLGERAWRLPKVLDRIVPDLDIEGHRLAVELEHAERGAASVAAASSDGGDGQGPASARELEQV